MSAKTLTIYTYMNYAVSEIRGIFFSNLVLHKVLVQMQYVEELLEL